MIRDTLTNGIREVIPTDYRSRFWWIAPLSGILICPLGSLICEVLIRIGIYEAVRLEQFVCLFSLIYGPVVGISVLLLIRYSGTSLQGMSGGKWLSRFAIVTPFLFLLVIFEILKKN